MSTLALIAHDNKKADLLAWATYNRDTLARFALVATRQTAHLMRDKVGLSAEALLSGPEGGDAQIAARVATREVVAPHEPDVRALLRVCNVHNAAVATNVATADLLIAALSGTAPQPAAVRAP